MMRRVSYLGRLCFRFRTSQSSFIRYQKTSSISRWNVLRSNGFGKLPQGRKCIWAAALTPAAFIELSEEDNGDGKTPEEHMLEASRAEIQKRVPENLHGLKKKWRQVYIFIDRYVYEPIATALRFFHLVFIFVPVIASTPTLWFGRRLKNRNNERSGTIWWYSFLVHSMERAGPAFIKVFHSNHHSSRA